MQQSVYVCVAQYVYLAECLYLYFCNLYMQLHLKGKHVGTDSSYNHWWDKIFLVLLI